jgi:hypothetical protein
MAKKEINQQLPSDTEASKFEMLEKLLASIYGEMKEFSKKKPDEPLNKFKIKNINRVLEPIKDILKNEPSNEFLDLLDEESLPSYSDCILIIGQFNSAMHQFYSRYHGWTGISYEWNTKENPVRFRR